MPRYALRGRAVPVADIVAEITVADVPDREAFRTANRSRICDRPNQDTILFTLRTNPPGEMRPQLVIGRDPNVSDIVFPDPNIDNKCMVLGFDQERLYLNDVSTHGCEIAMEDRGGHRTTPQPDRPCRCVVPSECHAFAVQVRGFRFFVRAPDRTASESTRFLDNQRVFLAERFGNVLETLSSITQAPPPHLANREQAAGESRDMYWFDPFTLGSGSFGYVSRVRRLRDGAVFAAKEMHSGQPFAHEMELLRRLDHPSIVQYIDWYKDTETNYVLVMEFCPHGSLERHLDQGYRFSKQQVAEALQQTADGLCYLHSHNIAHRDLKSGNILVRSRQPLSVAISDFGLSKDKSRHEEDPACQMSPFCGTKPYMAPEIGDRPAAGCNMDAVDIWALGVVGIELLEGGLPSGQWAPLPMEAKLARDIIQYDYTIFKKAKDMHAKDPQDGLLSVIRIALTWVPEERPSAAAILERLNKLLGITTVPAAPAQQAASTPLPQGSKKRGRSSSSSPTNGRKRAKRGR